MSDNKLAEEREQRRNAFLAWDIENELPLDIGEYHLERIDKQEERIYKAFGWTSSKNGWQVRAIFDEETMDYICLLYTSPSPRDVEESRMPSSA